MRKRDVVERIAMTSRVFYKRGCDDVAMLTILQIDTGVTAPDPLPNQSTY